jgi:hypothetical protein
VINQIQNRAGGRNTEGIFGGRETSRRRRLWLLITTEAMVAEVPKKQPPAPCRGGGMGGMDY